jgi:glycosyltransferase involved in cell wall biosynthesis
MRICHVLEATGGGSALCVLQLAKLQLYAGHDVTLIYAATRADQRFVELLAKIDRLRIVEITMRRGVGWHDVAALICLMSQLIKLGPFEVIHGHSSKAGALVRLAGVVFPKAAKIYTPHAFVTMGAEGSWFYKLIERWLGRIGDAVIVLSAAEQHHAQHVLKLPKTRTYLVANGIELGAQPDRSAARRLLSPAADDIIIGFVGRLVPQKNPLRALEAFVKLNHPTAKLVMIGDGPLAERLDQAIIRHGLQHRVSRQGNVDASGIMPGFDCLLCTSDYEGFAMIFLEALRAGVPIITTPVGGSVETVMPYKTGYITRGHTSDQLSEALRWIVDADCASRVAMRQACLRHVQHFSAEIMAAATEQVYHTVLQRKAM